MPVRESIGLSKDTIVRSLGVIGHSEDPVPPPPPPPVYIRYTNTLKTHPPWFDLDDTYNGNTAWFSSSWNTGDVSFLAKRNGANWDYFEGPGVIGFYAPPPTTVVNHDIVYPLSSAYGLYVYSGDEIAIVAYRLTAYIDPDTVYYSIPYLEEHIVLYENDGVTVLHDFGALQIDLDSYNPPPSAFPPGFYLPPSSDFYVSSSFIIP